MQPTRILIGYDASDCAIAALNDLPRAGLSGEIEAVVLSISEQWVPELSVADDTDVLPVGTSDDAAPEQEPHHHTTQGSQTQESRGMQALHEAEQVAAEGASRVRAMFPQWFVRSEARANGPAWGILEAADEHDTDLIIVGSHGRRALARLVLGSVSLRVLTDARCNVRIARSPHEPHRPEVRIVVGLDGSAHALTALKSIVDRRWTSGAIVRLVAVVSKLIGEDDRGSDLDAIEDLRAELIKQQIETAKTLLAPTPAIVEVVLRAGDPATALLSEAEEWGADAIVAGARGEDVVESGPVGSVASKIAARAHCSVEIVRDRNARRA